MSILFSFSFFFFLSRDSITFHPSVISVISRPQAILETAAAGGTVKTFVLTSSMSAVAPVPEPSLKNEG